MLNPSHNKYWLDLGCGKCKFFNQIKTYNPKKYTGIDIDIKNTIKTYKKYNEENIFELYNCDLGLNWDNSNYKIYNIDYNIKYDYIICNFSLMHFSTDLFWSQLDKITKKGTIFIFNLTSENVNWNLNNSYLRSTNIESELYFEWMHSDLIKEKLISSSEIIKITNKYGWKIVNKIKYDNNLLIRCYDWYTIVKD
jgi:ubiquinone/menaquinone biosynthesis C-methylase UbiE